MATEDEVDEEELAAAEMHAEPGSTAEAAQRAAQVAGQVKQAHLQERTRLEEDAIGMLLHPPGRACLLLPTHATTGKACECTIKLAPHTDMTLVGTVHLETLICREAPDLLNHVSPLKRLQRDASAVPRHMVCDAGSFSFAWFTR